MCKTDVHRYCEKFSNVFPFPVEEQNCHFEPKKICELQQKTRPKKAKKYSYTKDCKEQPREICECKKSPASLQHEWPNLPLSPKYEVERHIL